MLTWIETIWSFTRDMMVTIWSATAGHWQVLLAVAAVAAAAAGWRSWKTRRGPAGGAG